MGVIGRFIDQMPDAALDRVLEAQDWCAGDLVSGPSRCLVGHAADWGGWQDFGVRPFDHDVYEWTLEFQGSEFGGKWLDCTEIHFDRLAHRVGVDRAVSLVKQRAGKRTRVDMPQPALATASPE